MERDCCEFICGAPTTFQGYGIEMNRKGKSLWTRNIYIIEDFPANTLLSTHILQCMHTKMCYIYVVGQIGI